MTCFEDEEDDKNENGDDENKFEAKNSEDDERKVGPGTPRNTKEPQGTPPMQSYVSTTQVTNEWAISTIENNSATPRDMSSVRAWMESSKYGEYEKKSKYDQRTAGSREINIERWVQQRTTYRRKCGACSTKCKSQRRRNSKFKF